MPNNNDQTTQLDNSSMEQGENQNQPKPKSWLWWVSAVVILATVGYGGWYFGKSNNANNPSQPTPNSPVVSKLAPSNSFAEAQKNFGFSFLQQLNQNKDNQNKSVIISPLSIESALAMVLDGSEKQTKTEIVQAMGLKSANENTLNKEIKDTFAKLTSHKDLSLEVANSMWGSDRKDISFSQNYVSALKNNFGAEIKSVTFGDPKTTDLINGWVSQKTHGKIPEIIKETTSAQILALINAVYFKGQWASQFMPQATTDKLFTAYDKSQKNVPTMAQGGHFDYYSDQDVQIIKLPYKDSQMSMVVVLPSGSVDGLVNQLTSAQWQNWMQRLENKKGTLELPKFTYSYLIDDMIPYLESLGMRKAFANGDFNPMFTKAPVDPVAITKAIHKTYMKVDENGTEAAAVTYLGFVAISSMPQPDREQPFLMQANHPFLFSIVDDETNSMLFLGTINNISQE